MSQWRNQEPTAEDIGEARRRVGAACAVTKAATDEVAAAETHIRTVFAQVNAGGVFRANCIARASLLSAMRRLEQAFELVQAGADDWPTEDDWEIE